MSAKPHVRFQRPNYVVTDLDRALTVYRDILGLEIAFTKNSEKTSYSYEVFQIDPAADMRFAVLSTQTQTNVMALTELKGIELPEVPLPSRSAIVLECEDFDGVMNNARAAGLKVFDESRLETKDGRIGRELGFLDYDGNLIVIYIILENSDA
ncbi:VOC family protein [Temperatibacter marinus]|uniref:VOC family protein n=1 Tax=Temperatibacter marinus TaxID=1456591 RepID=A0AA52EJ67_9PROT|nr:VOC family protein [Temperatibacter marinus]WND03484.1 VOC family protein [Temperatibacter marinus]